MLGWTMCNMFLNVYDLYDISLRQTISVILVRSLQKNSKRIKTLKDTDLANKCSKQKDKGPNISMFLPQNYVLLFTESTYSISPALSPLTTPC